ncbi:hypothetical protein B0H19DRAFT_704621 [Mycena capillaripes]|nr:hypothetical protein B0H19DRAFT_704621 [Mycena capillaripes]
MDCDSTWSASRSLWMGGESVEEIKVSSEKEVTDEFLKLMIVNGDTVRIKEETRSMCELVTVSVLGLPDQPMEVAVAKDLGITTISRYSAEFPFRAAFPPQHMTNVLAERLSKQDMKQPHVADGSSFLPVFRIPIARPIRPTILSTPHTPISSLSPSSYFASHSHLPHISPHFIPSSRPFSSHRWPTAPLSPSLRCPYLFSYLATSIPLLDICFGIPQRPRP